jgi:hypothetical protein
MQPPLLSVSAKGHDHYMLLCLQLLQTGQPRKQLATRCRQLVAAQVPVEPCRTVSTPARTLDTRGKYSQLQQTGQPLEQRRAHLRQLVASQVPAEGLH